MLFQRSLQAALILPLLSPLISAQTACNNSPSLCNRAYNNITHLGAHDSPFLRDESTSFSSSGNQFFDTTTQLDAGVRLLSAQVHKLNNTSGTSSWHLCHSSCDLLDAGTLSSWLTEIKEWMDDNPNDVVTILLVNADNATPSDLGEHFSLSGISPYAYIPPSTTPPTSWPTLQTLITANTRLLAFSTNITPDPTTPYLMDEFTFIFENDFENTSPTSYTCTPHRPTSLRNVAPADALASNRMFLMNHFLYDEQLFGIQSPDVDYVNVTNAALGEGSLGTQLEECTTAYAGQPPTFVLVDFFNVGPAIASVDRVNGVSEPVGRRFVTDRVVDESTSKGVRVAGRGSGVAVVVAVVGLVVFGG
ncbi:hypothetical protein M011DRAFT_401204 [Sporormia fimetaria CBS 119925]|uniref:PLC-like phosphodiesterase n=1 Tax=Sporormia fimetaria CBS 119925 TaxID=1340428 RepID=A0A6A6VEC9_9PLEO|nr:hypothetical protein M011DRAFT_401204 [Sporormia fimetaria CBS 119925]